VVCCAALNICSSHTLLLHEPTAGCAENVHSIWYQVSAIQCGLLEVIGEVKNAGSLKSWVNARSGVRISMEDIIA